jgi:hypothetical protein
LDSILLGECYGASFEIGRYFLKQSDFSFVSSQIGSIRFNGAKSSGCLLCASARSAATRLPAGIIVRCYKKRGHLRCSLEVAFARTPRYPGEPLKYSGRTDGIRNMMSSEALRKNEQYCREQAEVSLGSKDQWLKMADDWAALAEQREQESANPVGAPRASSDTAD